MVEHLQELRHYAISQNGTLAYDSQAMTLAGSLDGRTLPTQSREAIPTQVVPPHTYTRPLLPMAPLLVCNSHEGVDKDVERVLESPLTTSVLSITTLLVHDDSLYTNVHLRCVSSGQIAGQCAVNHRSVLYPPSACFSIKGEMAERSKAPA